MKCAIHYNHNDAYEQKLNLKLFDSLYWQNIMILQLFM